MASVEDVEEALFAIISVFDEQRILYAVMGGLAVRVYALPRATQDVDVTISIERDRLPMLREKLGESGCAISPVYDSNWLDSVEGMPLFKVKRYVGSHSVDIDIFIAESAFQEALIQRRTLHKVNDRQVALVSPEDLVLLKLIASRPRDWIDVQDLLFTLGTLDESYMRKWAAQLGVSEKLEEALKEASG